MPKKMCSACLIKKPFSEFWSRKERTPGGPLRDRHQSYCKSCSNKHKREWIPNVTARARAEAIERERIEKRKPKKIPVVMLHPVSMPKQTWIEPFVPEPRE